MVQDDVHLSINIAYGGHISDAGHSGPKGCYYIQVQGDGKVVMHHGSDPDHDQGVVWSVVYGVKNWKNAKGIGPNCKK